MQGAKLTSWGGGICAWGNGPYDEGEGEGGAHKALAERITIEQMKPDMPLGESDGDQGLAAPAKVELLA